MPNSLLPMVDELLAEGGIALAALDAIAFGRGPGGFTGVRLAASVAQGLAFGAGLGVVPVSDLAAVAQRAAGLQPGARRVLAVNDARMREVYWAEFTADGTVRAVERRTSGPSAGGQSPRAGATAWVAAGRGLRAAPELAERCRAAGAALLRGPACRGPMKCLLLARPAGGGGANPASGAGIARLCQGSRRCHRFVIKVQ